MSTNKYIDCVYVYKHLTVSSINEVYTQHYQPLRGFASSLIIKKRNKSVIAGLEVAAAQSYCRRSKTSSRTRRAARRIKGWFGEVKRRKRGRVIAVYRWWMTRSSLSALVAVNGANALTGWQISHQQRRPGAAQTNAERCGAKTLKCAASCYKGAFQSALKGHLT